MTLFSYTYSVISLVTTRLMVRFYILNLVFYFKFKKNELFLYHLEISQLEIKQKNISIYSKRNLNILKHNI